METIRERTENTEDLVFSSLAAKSRNATRTKPEEKSDIRTEYQRDRDRIIHCRSFRRLKHKTQVFLSPEGDHYRTRLTHTLEVAQISRTVARALRLNEDLTEAIALGHDLGHTPFGHAGERALDAINANNGGFKHYEQSVRVCTVLEKRGKGLNLTSDTLDGILCHTSGKEAKTLEGRIVRICDKIAYINHDIDDAVRAGIIENTDIPQELRKYFGETKSNRINYMVKSVVENSNDTIKMSEEDGKMFSKLHEFLFSAVYLNPKAKAEERKVNGFIQGIFSFIIENPHLLPEEYSAIAQNEGFARAVTDYIAGMTDTFAIQFYKDAFIPKAWETR